MRRTPRALAMHRGDRGRRRFRRSPLAHAEISPAVALSGQLQLYSLAVPTEKDNVTTTKVVLTRAERLRDRLVRAQPRAGSGRCARPAAAITPSIQQVTWTGGHVPTGEDSLFQFLAQPAASRTYTFTVEQTYSDGRS